MILVTGANGMVGSYVKEIFNDQIPVLTDIPEMDVTDPERVFSLFARHRPAMVLHLAAETNVDRCEKDHDHAFKTNALGTHNVALACQKYDAVMIYISTDMVFNGRKGKVHTEYDDPTFANVYGKSKYEGERAVKELLNRYYIFRAGWMIGGGPEKDKKFVGKIIEISKLRSEIQAVNDKYGSLTYARHLVAGIKKIVKTGYYGLYHLVNTGEISRYDIAIEMMRILKRKVTVVPVSSDKFPLPAPRAESGAMRNMKLDFLGINPMPGWKEALEEYLGEWEK